MDILSFWRHVESPPKIYKYSEAVKRLAAIQSAKERTQGEADGGLDQTDLGSSLTVRNRKRRH